MSKVTLGIFDEDDIISWDSGKIEHYICAGASVENGETIVINARCEITEEIGSRIIAYLLGELCDKWYGCEESESVENTATAFMALLKTKLDKNDETDNEQLLRYLNIVLDFSEEVLDAKAAKNMQG